MRGLATGFPSLRLGRSLSNRGHGRYHSRAGQRLALEVLTVGLCISIARQERDFSRQRRRCQNGLARRNRQPQKKPPTQNSRQLGGHLTVFRNALPTVECVVRPGDSAGISVYQWLAPRGQKVPLRRRDNSRARPHHAEALLDAVANAMGNCPWPRSARAERVKPGPHRGLSGK